jgi:hypothetical protein
MALDPAICRKQAITPITRSRFHLGDFGVKAIFHQQPPNVPTTLHCFFDDTSPRTANETSRYASRFWFSSLSFFSSRGMRSPQATITVRLLAYMS